MGFLTDHTEVLWDLDREASEAAAAAGLGFVPVSYTHLDVYKRQGQGGPRLASCSRGRSCLTGWAVWRAEATGRSSTP